MDGLPGAKPTVIVTGVTYGADDSESNDHPEPPMSSEETQRMPATSPAAPTLAELAALIEAAPVRSSTGQRNRALVALLLYGGLRVNEALGLTPADVAPDSGTVRIRGRAAERVVPIMEPGRQEIARWLSESRDMGVAADAPLLATRAGTPLTGSYVRELLPRLARGAGIAGRISAEVLRQAHIAELVLSGWSVRRIQAHLGHAAPSSTRRLLSRIEPALVGRGSVPHEPAPPSDPTSAARRAPVEAAMADAVDVAAFVVDAAGVLVAANRAAGEMSAKPPAELVGRRLPLPMLPGLGAAEIAAHAGGAPFRMDGRDPAGRVFPALVTVSDHVDGGRWRGHAVAVEHMGRHLAPIRRLRASREAFRSVAEHAPDAILRFDRDLRVSYANAHLERMLGTAPSLIVGRHADEGSVPPEIAASLEREVSAVLAAERPRSFEVATAGGGRRFEWRLRPEFAADGHLSHVLCFGRDITERHRVEERLARAAVDNAIQMRVLMDAIAEPHRAGDELAARVGEALGAQAAAVTTRAPGRSDAVSSAWSTDPGANAEHVGAALRAAADADGAAHDIDSVRVLRRAVVQGTDGRPGPMAIAPIGAGGGVGRLLVAFAEGTPVGVPVEARIGAFARTCAGVAAVSEMHRAVGSDPAREGWSGGEDRLRTAIIAGAGALLGGDGGMLVAVADDGTGAVVSAWATGNLPRPSPVGTTLTRHGSCASARCLDSNDSALVEDVTLVADPLNDRIAAAGFRSALAVPIHLTGDGVPGVLCVVSRRPHAFDRRDTERLEVFAGALSAAR